MSLAAEEDFEAKLGAIGGLVEDPARRSAWVALVRRLESLARPGMPLAGRAFHGTELGRARSVARHGMLRTHASVNGVGAARNGWRWTTATHWATPAVAAFYAEDLIESLERQIDLAIVTARIDDLAGCGRLAADGQSVDIPIESRLRHDHATACALWLGSRRTWRDSHAANGSFTVLAAIPAELIDVVEDEAGLDTLLARIAEGR